LHFAFIFYKEFFEQVKRCKSLEPNASCREKVTCKKEKIHSTPENKSIGNLTSPQVIRFFVNSLYKRTFFYDYRFLILWSSGTCRPVFWKNGTKFFEEDIRSKILRAVGTVPFYQTTQPQPVSNIWLQQTKQRKRKTDSAHLKRRQTGQ